ncbi:asialoglycoprotein receptor 2-like [Protopterus annectens]|uniref:asialoglycoprotein receptor 2-like n=1 Tax=Protopterus annectens TaxID=7888 RepID=UPI001CF9747F|nr:asialoglycoprotein receptor 2-like [Protopterus annectens]
MTAGLQKAAKEEIMKLSKGHTVVLVMFGIALIALVVMNIISLSLTVQISEERSHYKNGIHAPEVRKTAIMTTKEGCIPKEEISFQNECYFFSSDMPQLTWIQSRDYCKQRNSDLVIIKSPELQEFLTMITIKDGFFYWIGLRNFVGKTWKWVDGTTCDVTDKNTTYFIPGKPSGNDTGYCVFMSSQNGLWDTQKCDYNYRWACVRKIIH